MGGEQAAKVLQQIEIARLKKKGEKPDESEQKELFDTLAEKYEHQTSPVYAAARLWVDAIIDPEDTRHWISSGIAMASHAPVEAFRTGVIQT